jgi:hypothetical protein
VTVHISDDASGKENLFGPFDDSVVGVVIDSYERQASGKLKIPAGTTEPVSFGDVDQVRGIFLKVDQDAMVRLNGSGDTIQLRRAGATAKLFLEADLSSLEVAAPAGGDVQGIYSVWGDPAA